MTRLLLNVSSTMSRSRANGPGTRAVIWVQGCTIGCPGCYSAPTHPHSANSLVAPSEIAEWILSIPEIEGITISGGEPFEQAAALVDLVKNLRSIRPSMTLFIFTGYEHQALLQSEEKSVHELLQLSDMLSSGPYAAKHRDQNLLWRGSSNQELHYLSEAYNRTMEDQWRIDSPTEEYSIQEDRIQFTGFGGKKSNVLRMASELIGLNSTSKSV